MGEPRPKGAASFAAVRWLLARLFVVCLAAFCCTASGRITYPDDEISFRTAEAIYERGAFDITPMDRRTGERPDRPDGSFGVAPGTTPQTQGKHFGFFGYALPLLTAPAIAMGDMLARAVPTWRHAIRGDLFGFYARNPTADMRRMAVTLSNTVILALAICAFALWLAALGFSRRAVATTALAFGLCTYNFAYASTYLSEPLSTLLLCAAAWQIRVFHSRREGGEPGRRALAIAATLTGLSVHAHLLNVLAVPCLLAYAAYPSWRAGRLGEEGKSWALALTLGAIGPLSLAWLNAWRFGSVFESGRYDHYGAWTSPFEAMGAFLFGPGRSVFLFAPPIAIGLWLAWRHRRQTPTAARTPLSLEAKLALALVLSRALFVAARSDWHGGWGLGPRYGLPVLPFAMLPFAHAVQRQFAAPAGRLSPALRWGLVALGLVFAYMAYHSIFEHMFMLANAHGRAHYYAVSHWSPSANPLSGYWRIDAPVRARLFDQGPGAALGLARFDALSFGALRLGLVMRDWSLFAVMSAIGLAGSLAGISLWRGLRRDSGAADDLSP